MQGRIRLVDTQRNGPRMDITALVDCVFLLLIFFLLTSTYMNRRQIEVDLPPLTSGQPVTDDGTRLDIVVDRTGQYLLDDLPITESDLSARLVTASEAGPDMRVSVRTDREAPAGRVIFILDAARAAGLGAVDLEGRDTAKTGSNP